MGAAAWLLVSLAVTAEHGFATASLSAEVYGADTLQNGGSGLAADLSVQPTVDVGYLAGPFRVDVGYHPLFTLTNLTPALLHRVQATGEWRLSPSRRALVDQQLSFGQYDTSLGSLGQAGGSLIPNLLPLGLVDYLTSDTAAGFDGALAPRLRLRASAGYHVSGGLTETARQGLPLQQGPRLALELQHQATQRDALAGYVKLSGDQFSNGKLAAIAEGGLTWRSTLTRELALTVGAGGAAVDSTDSGLTAKPEGALGLTYGVPRGRVALDASLAPQADELSGDVFQRAGLTASGEYHPRSDLTARANFGGSWSVQGTNVGDRSLLGEASLAYHEKTWEVSAGLRAADVALSSAGITHATELRVFVGFSLKAAAVR